jgi:hypothetical protein
VAIVESVAREIAQNYILETNEYLAGLLSDRDFDDPSSYFTNTDPLDCYRHNIRPTWIFRFYLSQPDDLWLSAWGWPPPSMEICVDAQTGQVWKHRTPKYPSSQQQRTARKQRRDDRRNNNP